MVERTPAPTCRMRLFLFTTMPTKFFNNVGLTLFDKLKGIAESMTNFDRFLAVAGFFRSSGYFKLREELDSVNEIKILVGINVDEIFRRHNQALLMLSDPEQAKGLYRADFCHDVISAQYTPEVERGILQMYEDIHSGKLQMRIHPTKNLHAKFYLCLPQEHNVNSDGWVIMGSSNISEAGLGISTAQRYELNVAMKDYDDVNYCLDQFNELWNESVPLTEDDVEKSVQKTYLGDQPTPYEIYIKVLIDTFGDLVEDDFDTQLPAGIKELKYQKDAVIQGYQMMMQHNGVLLADVVGLGKTIIATMIAKRFIEENGRRDTHILVVYPPSLADNWRETFKLFGISRNAQFVTNGSLAKVLEGQDRYRDPQDFSLIIVDEAHGFRNDGSGKYDELQKICKAPCAYPGMLKNKQKKVVLLSATPINNRPDDLLNLLLLFQNGRSCTIDGIPNIKAYFAPYIAEYKRLMSERDTRDVTDDVDRIYEEIRSRVIDKITVRRTRTNIQNDPEYRADIEAQGIVFPSIAAPQERVYQMDRDTSTLFYETLQALTDENAEQHLTYARYRAVEFLTGNRKLQYPNAVNTGRTLAGIYRVHMVKRLESSFYAFKRSLKTLHRITCDMLKMFEKDCVIIAPELDVKRLQEKDMELEEIIALALEKGFKEDEIRFSTSDFDPQFVEMLHNDRDALTALIANWDKITFDPKLELFCKDITGVYLSKNINPTGKLVVFSESVDTLNYLNATLQEKLGRKDVLLVTASNRSMHGNTIKENFDANCEVDAEQYNLLLTSDVLAEGINLHRSNVIINYDSPWNASRLMQRIGRVNRIGSTADTIRNFLFYPSQQGDREIQLYKNALIKLQGFHSAFGEDAQIFSREEIVKQFKLFDSTVKDSVDEKLALLREVRNLYAHNRAYYHKIKALPQKSRVMRRSREDAGKTIAFVSSPIKTEYYLCSGTSKPQVIDLLEAVKYLKADPQEEAAKTEPQLANQHYQHVNAALDCFRNDHVIANDVSDISPADLDNKSRQALNYLRSLKRFHTSDARVVYLCDCIIKHIEGGVYSPLPKKIVKLSRTVNKNDIQPSLEDLVTEYRLEDNAPTSTNDYTDPGIIISETFI